MRRERRKRIYNPVTGKYYSVKQRTTKRGKAGQITGLWKPKKKKREESIWDLF